MPKVTIVFIYCFRVGIIPVYDFFGRLGYGYPDLSVYDAIGIQPFRLSLGDASDTTRTAIPTKMVVGSLQKYAMLLARYSDFGHCVNVNRFLIIIEIAVSRLCIEQELILRFSSNLLGTFGATFRTTVALEMHNGGLEE